MTKSEHLDKVSAAWILACNDENCLLTYEGLKQRLEIKNNEVDVKQLIRLHGELFRQRAPENGLEVWRQDMLRGSRRPRWIKEIESEDKRVIVIKNLSADDIFRSQFRAKHGSPQSSIETISWGLEHIERIRKSSLEERQERLKIVTSIWIPIISMLISLGAVITGYFLQRSTIRNQNVSKKMELEYKTRQEGYTGFIKSVISAYSSAGQSNGTELVKALDNIETSYYNIEHLLNEKLRSKVWSNFQKFSIFCLNTQTRKINDAAYADSCMTYKTAFRNDLQIGLFGNARMNY
jgi:hypothetical protein